MKWVLAIVAILLVACTGICAAGGLFYYTSTSSDDLALPDFQPVEPVIVDPVDAAATTGSGDVGVAECDAYIKTMTECLSSMDPAMKSAMEESFKQTTDAWRSAAATEAGKASLAVGCKAALDAIPSNCTMGGTAAGATATTEPTTPATTEPTASATTGSTTTSSSTPPATSSSTTASSTTTKPATTTSSTSSSSSTTKPATTTTKPATTSTTTSKSTTTTPATTTTTSTSTTKQGTGLKPKTEDDDVGAPPPPADATVAVGFVLPSGGKWDDLVVGMDGKSLGKRPLRTRASPGVHTFTFKAEGIDLSCSIEVGSSGRTIILDAKKKSCPSKSS